MKSKLMSLTLITLLVILTVSISSFVPISSSVLHVQLSSSSFPINITIDGDLSDWDRVKPVVTDAIGDTFQWSKNATILGVGSTAEKPGMATGNVTKNDMCRDLKALYFVSTNDTIYVRLDVAGLYPGWNNQTDFKLKTPWGADVKYNNVSMWVINFDFASGGYPYAAEIIEELGYSVDTRPDFYLEWDGNVGAVLGDPQRDATSWDIIVDNAATGGLEVATNITAGAFEFSFSRESIEGFFGLSLGPTYVWAMSYKPGQPTGSVPPSPLRRIFDPQAPGTSGEGQSGGELWPSGTEYTWTDPWGNGHNLTFSPAVNGMDGNDSVTGNPITLTYPIPIDFADIFSQTGNNLDTFTWAPGSWQDSRATLNEAARFEVDLTPWATIIGPKADFTYVPRSPRPNQTITFDASASLPGWNGTDEAPIVSYAWNFSDGTPIVTETDPITTHKFTAKGTYNVTLNVTDTKGLWQTKSKTVTASLAPSGPTAYFVYEPATALTGQTVTFNASLSAKGYNNKTETEVAIANYTWNFGDGSSPVTETDPVTTHAYTAAATYTVNLTVMCEDDPLLITLGLTSDTTSRTITISAVHDVAVTGVTPSPTEVTVGETVNITVVVENNGTAVETFNVTAYYDTTEIDTQTVTDLAAEDTETLTFTWNTTGVAADNYTITATVTTVIPGETNFANNEKIDGQVKLKEKPVGPEIPWLWIIIGVVVVVVVIIVAYMLTRRKPAKPA